MCVALTLLLAFGGGCFSGEEGETFYGRVVVPRSQEFRWSDGGVPRVFDPARAAAPPDTDAVRALYEGLTDNDPQTLKPVVGAAARWESADGDRVWTFHLRPEARWSNGDQVTAQDFARSWKRTLRLGEDAPHSELLANLIAPKPTPQATPQTVGPTPTVEPPRGAASGESAAKVETPAVEGLNPAETIAAGASLPELAVEAVDDQTLRVRLQRPDKNFPALVAHPVFRPVHSSVERAAEVKPGASSSPLISNGAFRLSESGGDSVLLEREGNYWNASQVALERVRFVGARDPEAALSAYRAGEVDAVTNARIEPVALKLLASYKDFRRSTFGALTYYDFNPARPPFDDARVRQALARALDRRRLTADTLEGAADPAEKFLPPPAGGDGAAGQLTFDPDAARRLLAEAGYPGGAGFPRVRLLLNRNEQHRKVADAVAAMWSSVLGVETDVLLRDWAEYETLLRTGEYDVARRSLVMQTADEELNVRALFAPERFDFDARTANESVSAAPAVGESPAPVETELRTSQPTTAAVIAPILTEAQALREVPAIPLYFASSHALVKPYVQGFDTNFLDAPSLLRVRIDANWQPPKTDPRVVIRGGE